MTHDWHNAYASFVIDLSHMLQNAPDDAARLALMETLRARLDAGDVPSTMPARPIPPASELHGEPGGE
jgi:metallo-beta-lactamase family protein